jgi:hypothetical protein
MASSRAQTTPDDQGSKWGYATAGAIALGFAAVIQFAFGGLDDEALASLPAFIVVPYEFAGKLGLTVPLAALGLILILRDVIPNLNGVRGTKGAPAALRRPARKPALVLATGGDELPVADEMEAGEPLADEERPRLHRPRIVGLPGRFDGRLEGSGSERSGSERSEEKAKPQVHGMALSTEKYMKKPRNGQ